MSDIHQIPKNLLILVCDARKAILLRNSNSALRPALEVIERVDAEPSPRSLQESNRAGRRFDANSASASFQSRSAMDQTDPKRRSAEEFSQTVIQRLERIHEGGLQYKLLIAAPPAFLGLLRDRMPAAISDLIIAEVPKHLTEARLDEISTSLAKTYASMR